MSKHSKNNNASSVFTYAERQMLKYGTQMARVGRDSLRDFDACFLCLERLRDPVSCLNGHLACRECVLENILAQRKAIDKAKKDADSLEQLREIEEQQKQAIEQQKEIDNFQKAQSSLLPSDISKISVSSVEEKRVENSFWIPKNAPEVKQKIAVDLKTQIQCPMGNDHPLHAKKLISVKFSEEKSSLRASVKGKSTNMICPSCKKQITNAMPLVLLRNCGHVICKVCTDKFVKVSAQCFVCEEPSKTRDFIPIVSDGTGFSSRGNVEIKKYDVAFKA